MAIKNWFVRSERVKDKHNGIIRYGKYLVDESHPNHTQTSSIIPISGNIDTFIKRVSNEAITLDISNSQKKGGRPVQSYAQSFVFCLPPSVKKPTTEEWKEITKDIVKEIAKKLEVSLSDLNGKIFANVHDQDNPHLNLVVPRVLNGKSLKALDQKGTISVAKKAFTAATLAHCGLDVSAYEPLQTNLGRKQAKWKIQEQKAEKALLLVGHKTQELDDKLKQSRELDTLSIELNSKIFEWVFAVKADSYMDELVAQSDISDITDKIDNLNINQEQKAILDRLFESAEQKAGKALENRVRWKI